jgi:hypothetical protein
MGILMIDKESPVDVLTDQLISAEYRLKEEKKKGKGDKK